MTIDALAGIYGWGNVYFGNMPDESTRLRVWRAKWAKDSSRETYDHRDYAYWTGMKIRFRATRLPN